MSQHTKILVPGDDPPQIAGSPQLDRLASYGELKIYKTRPLDSEEQIRRALDFDIIMNTRGSVSWHDKELRALPRIRMIAACSIGTDMIDLRTARELGIVVSNQPGRTAPIVAEHTFGLMLAVAKRAALQTTQVKAGLWTGTMNILLQGKILGIVGTGNTGAEMARLGRAIGMEIIAWTFNPSKEKERKLGVRFVELDELLQRADVVSLHVRLSEDTRQMIAKRELQKMKPTALLVNCARGEIVDVDALADALQADRLGGAALDVFPEEPFPKDHPLIGCKQVVFTSHMADQTPEGIELLNEGAVDNVIAFLEGRPQNNVAI